MVSPITVATHGLLNSPLSVAAIRGRLYIDSEQGIVGILPGGSSDPAMAHQVILARLKREDDEILAIIMASVDIIE